MHSSNGFPHMLTLNQRGRGHEPVTVVGNIRLAVAVNIVFSPVAMARGWWLPRRKEKILLQC